MFGYSCFRFRFIVAALLLFSPAQTFAQAHFSPGVANIRDYAVPEPGLYLAVYNYGYKTSTLTDDNGNKISQVVLGPAGGPNVPVNIDVDAKIYALAPAILWITNWKFLGATYGMYAIPSFANNNISASLSTIDGAGINPEIDQFAMADPYFQPVWLGWNRKHVDVALAYGFYAPLGRYNTETINLPVVGPRKVTSSDNVGLGYWTHQLQGNVSWYPNVNRMLAISNTITAEFNGKQRGFDITNGNYLTWNWGASQYVLLGKTPKYLLEFGPTGYDQWQITDTTGADSKDGNLHTPVHGAGFQVGVTHLKLGLQLNFRFLGEFYAANRLRGTSFGLNLAYTIRKPKPAASPAKTN